MVVLLSGIFHALALLSSLMGTSYVPIEWNDDFLLLLCVSILLSIASPSIRSSPVLIGIFAFRTLIFVLVSIPQGPMIGIRFLLLASLLMDMGTFLPLRIGVSGCGLVSLLFISMQRPMMAFGLKMRSPSILESVTVLVVSMLFALVFIILRMMVEELSSARGRILRLDSSILQLTNANTDFLQYANVVERQSIVNERNRITRELHDVIGQTLTNIIMMMDAVTHNDEGSREDTIEIFKWTREQAREGLENTRSALYELRAIPDDRLKGVGAIKKLVDTFSRLSHAVIKVDWGNMPWELDEAIDLTVYRIVQESLSNSIRHGKAALIWIDFYLHQGCLTVTIRDNGKGGADEKKGIGQKGLEERVAKLNGSIQFRSEENGYLVLAQVPIVAGGQK